MPEKSNVWTGVCKFYLYMLLYRLFLVRLRWGRQLCIYKWYSLQYYRLQYRKGMKIWFGSGVHAQRCGSRPGQTPVSPTTNNLWVCLFSNFHAGRGFLIFVFVVFFFKAITMSQKGKSSCGRSVSWEMMARWVFSLWWKVLNGCVADHTRGSFHNGFVEEASVSVCQIQTFASWRTLTLCV